MDHRTRTKQSQRCEWEKFAFFSSVIICWFRFSRMIFSRAGGFFPLVRTSNVAYKQNMFQDQTESIIIIFAMHRRFSDFCSDNLYALEAIFIASESCSWNKIKQTGIISHIKAFMFSRCVRAPVHACCWIIQLQIDSMSNSSKWMAFDSHRLNNPGDGISMLISQMLF